MAKLKKRERKTAPPTRSKRPAAHASDAIRLRKELAEARAQQAATAAILKVIARSPSDAQPVFKAIVDHAHRLAGAVFSILYGFDGKTLSVLADKQSSANASAALRGMYPAPARRGHIVGRAVLDGRETHTTDIRVDARFPANRNVHAKVSGFRASLVVPLKRDRKVIGAVAVGRLDSRPFSTNEIHLLRAFAEQAVIAIENARRFRETKEALERQSATAEILKVIARSPSDVQPVFDAIAASAMRLLNARSAAVTRVAGDLLHLAAYTSTSRAGDKILKSLFPMPIETTGRPEMFTNVVRTGKVAYRIDIENDPEVPPYMKAMARARGFRSALAVPMLRDGAAIGTLNVTRVEPGRFTDHQIGLLQTFADQAVIAIENVRLFNETKEALEQQTAVSEVLRVISASPTDVMPVLEAVAARAARICDATDVRIFLVEGKNARHVTGFGDVPIKVDVFPISRETAGGRAMLDRASVHIPDIQAVAAEEFTISRSSAAASRWRTILAVPLMREDAALGAILLRRRQVRPFSEKQIALLRTFADQAAIAIENVRLFNETKESLERQTATSNVLREISRSTFDLDAILQTLLDNARRLCGAVNCAMFLKDTDGSFRFASMVRNVPNVSLEKTLRNNPIQPGADTTTGRALLERRTVHSHDIRAEPGYRPDMVAHADYRTNLAVPMLRDGEVIGAITLTRGQEVSPFTDKQIELVEGFSAQAVIAIENVRLFNQTRQALERQTATAEILSVIASSPSDVQPVFDTIAASALRLCDGSFSVVSRFDGQLIHLAAFSNLLPEHEDVIRGLWPMQPGRSSATARAISEAQVIQIPDALEDREYRLGSAADTVKFRSVLAVPMLRDGRPIGVINVNRQQPGNFPEHQITLLKTFADQAVIAIENVRLFNETKEALERQTATAEILNVISRSNTDTKPVFDAIARAAQQVFGGLASGISLVEGSSVRIVAMTGDMPEDEAKRERVMPLNRETAHARAIVDRAIVNIGDAQAPDAPKITRKTSRQLGFRAIAVAPIMTQGEAIGAISVARRNPGAFNPNQLSLLQTFADQAAIAIENVRLFNETREGLDQQTAISEVLRVISASPTDVTPVLDAVAARAARICDATDARIFLVEGDQLRHAAGFGDLAVATQTFPLDRGSASGRAVLERTPVQIEDIQGESGDGYAVSREIALRAGWRTTLVVPLTREKHVLGAIALRRREPRPFSKKQISLLSTFADQAAIAIENVRLFNETKEALERQTATAEILKVISSSPTDVQPVLDAIVQSSIQLVQSWNAAILMREGDSLYLRAAASPLVRKVRLEAFADIFPIPADPGLGEAGLAIAECRVVDLIDPESSDSNEIGRKIARVGRYRSGFAVPLVREGEGIGAIVLSHAEPGRRPSEKELALIQTFASQAVIAIENVRLFNETKEALERQTATAEILTVIASSPSDIQPVFDTIVRSAIRLMGGVSGGLFITDGNQVQIGAAFFGSEDRTERFRPDYPAPIDYNAPAVQAIRESRVLNVADLLESDYSERVKARARGTPYRSALNVPMLRGGRAIGSIAVTRAAPGLFPENHVSLLRTFADQAVIAIENVRLFNETKEALERQTATAEILKVISSSPIDVQPVFEAIVQSAARLFECGAAIQMRDGDRLQLNAMANFHGNEALAEKLRPLYPLPFDPEASRVSRAMQEGRILEVPDIDVPGAPRSVAAVGRASGFRAAANAPLLRADNVIGMLSLTWPDPGHKLDDKQRGMLRTFADQAVIAIENVRLFKELQSRTEALTKSVGQLTALGEVGRAVSSTLDLEQVLQTIVQRAVQLTGLDVGSIYEYDERAEEFHLKAAENMAPEFLEAVRRTPIRKGDGTVGGTAVTLQPAQVPDIRDESYRSSRKELLIEAGSRAVLTVPLLHEDRILGALSVTRRTPGPFAPEVVELMKTFATQSAMAIQNARLYREIAEKGKQLEVASRHKSQFLASMSHELRTPLNAILGFNEMLLGQVYGEVPVDMKEPLEDIQKSGKHLLRLINNVLDLAKIEAGRMELSLQDYSVQDTVESVRATLRPLAAEKGLEFLASVPAELPLAYGDSGRITQCLMNLAGNSLKFTKAGKVEIEVTEKDGLLTYRVSDTGVGIPPDKISSLFTEFKQTDATIASEYGGTGLGLSISKKFVEMHGGRIWIESELGKGSAFIFEIPLRVKTP